MAQNCHVRSKSNPELYIHFDQKRNAYLVHDSTIGACVFTAEMARAFITTGLQDPNHQQWEIDLLHGNMTRVSRDSEDSKKLLDNLQSQYDEYSRVRNR